MEAERVTIRLPGALMAACKGKADAAGLSVAAWLRSLAERETGIKADAKVGLSGVDAETKKRVAKTAAKARWKHLEGKGK